MQAAQLLARLAERNSADETYESPYTVEALRQGIDLGWFDKLRKTTFSPRDGGFKLGKLQARPPLLMPRVHTLLRQGFSAQELSELAAEAVLIQAVVLIHVRVYFVRLIRMS